ncbi:MAG: DUF4381 domain-containing protein [Gammaproteobacteria bacterium]|nr:DUF4381 domain-containing protein [Gammaproteobacteria bacterium]
MSDSMPNNLPSSSPGNPLDQLPPIHFPEAISLWPPAIGWWLLAGLLIVSTGLIVRFFLQRKRRNFVRKTALKELTRYWQVYQQNNQSAEYLTAVNRLLKQFVVQQYPNKNLHTLSGEQWINGLAELSPQSGLNSDSAVALLSIYARHVEQSNQDVNALYPLLVQWFNGLRLAS